MNKRKLLTKDQIEKIIHANEHNEKAFVLIINGDEIKSVRKYRNYMLKNLNIRLKFWPNWDAYLDIMQDPNTYFNKTEIIIIIYNYAKFLSNDTYVKNKIEYFYDTYIFQFFEEEVEECVVGGKKTKYNIYYTK